MLRTLKTSFQTFAFLIQSISATIESFQRSLKHLFCEHTLTTVHIMPVHLVSLSLAFFFRPLTCPPALLPLQIHIPVSLSLLFVPRFESSVFVSTVFHLSVLRMLCVLFGFFIILFFVYLFVCFKRSENVPSWARSRFAWITLFHIIIIPCKWGAGGTREIHVARADDERDELVFIFVF